MSRRVNMPTAEDLFRPTAVPDPPEDDAPHGDPAQDDPGPPEVSVVGETTLAEAPGASSDAGAAGQTGRAGASGRVRHETKMTVYVTEDELLDLEHARLQLRRRHGVAVDRGRLVREAVALALAELEERPEESPLLRRLAGE